MNARHVIATVLLFAGCGVEVLAAIGVAAMRDAFDRLHYVGLVSYGALLVGASIVVRESFSLIGDKALVLGALGAVTGPVLVHVTARSLRVRARGRWEEDE